MNTLITARQVAELAFDAGEFLPPGAVTEADISTAPRSDCFEPADEEQCTARLRALRRRARTLLHRMSEWLDAHAGEHPEYQPRENIFKRCTIDGNLVQIH